MILVAILIYVLAGLAPKWILKQDYEILREQFSWKIPLFKLSGLFVGLSLAFVLISISTFTTKKGFVENKNAIYGLEFNSVMEKLGFQDGMKIASINDKAVYKVSDIIETILVEYGKSEVCVDVNGIESINILDAKAKGDILKSVSMDFIKPIMKSTNNTNSVKITYENYNFSDVLARFKMLWYQAIVFVNPSPSHIQQVGGFLRMANPANSHGQALSLAFTLILLGILNLLPLPGFNVGNAIISSIETQRRKHYNKKKLIGYVSILIVILLLLI
ncbi:hypothetical protein DWB61_06070 [Ancylomarina euxinus]|uniref:Peptidase M50 domain-containing protein n=1 Tax=Ancylomarina euxinus TaxID=2283627 RepID=A0A425Y4D2_9BACT|nr:site-2 protease family protein [Ancylomarina euxinus]MCZ4694602.1 hypothetical protein [Ancylomarina euxinus]MUP14145.1 hypothetical protein [Ancylomarina euxinus]RRG23001.1 hypothetical protein DWB61_06070 [Ancylomarina euxinus]